MSNDNDFDSVIGQAWNDHADDARDVAGRLPQLQALATDEPQLMRVIMLTHHVYGAHLGEWDAGTSALRALGSHPAYRDDAASGDSMRRVLASLTLCAGGAPGGLAASDEIRAHAMAAESLCGHDTARAAEQFGQALALAERSALPDTDPMHRALAAASNGLACTLEEKTGRSSDEGALMILAAQAARRHWELAGTWLEVERAEYRLAMTWLQAGDLAQGRQHAQNCLEIVEANQAPALERFFGWEALGVIERAAGNASGYAQALEHARADFVELSADDQGWCRASLDKLASITSPAPG